MSYEKDKLDSYVTSASLSTALTTALAPYITSNSVSAAIAGINLAPYMTSNSISLAVTTNTLTVRGTASVSATLSAAAVTVATRPIGEVLIATATGSNVRSLAFSGSWSDFVILEIRGYATSTGGDLPINIYTDGGTTPILIGPLNAALSVGFDAAFNMRIMGVDGRSDKLIWNQAITSGWHRLSITSTANSGVINCIRVSLTTTASVAWAGLYGFRQT